MKKFENRFVLKTATVTTLLCAGSFLATATAQDATTDGWDGNIELGFANATGNSENTTLGFRVDAKKIIDRTTHNVFGHANYTESEGIETQNNYGVGYQLDQKVSDRTYYFGRATYDNDQFSGFDYRVFAGGGLGYWIVDNETRKWKIDGGPGVRFSKTTAVVPGEDGVPLDAVPVPSVEETEFSAYAGSDFDWVIRDGVVFEHDLGLTYSESSSTLSTRFGLTTQLTERMSSGISYQIDYETDPPAGREDTDTLLKASLLFGF